MSEENEEMIECPQCSHPIPMSDLEGKSEYTCPNCETTLELEDGDEGEESEAAEETETEVEETEYEEGEDEDASESEDEGEEETEEATDEEAGEEAGESDDEPESEPESESESEDAEEKPAKKKRTPRAKNPEEVKKYLDFIVRQPNGVQAPMVSEHFGVSERFSRLMIRNAIKMAEENGMKVETKTGGKGKRKTYIVHG